MTSGPQRPYQIRTVKEALLRFEWVADAELLVVCHVHGSVCDDVWGELTAAVRTNLSPRMRCLVWNDGGRPTVTQQRILLDVTRGTKIPVALVSSSVALRFIASVFTLANRNVRFFAMTDIDKALSYLCCDETDLRIARAVLWRLCEQMGVQSPTRGE